MSTAAQPASAGHLRGMNPLYPWSDGKPMAENSEQYRWIVTFQGNLEVLFRDRPDVFVAADNLIYPVEGHPEISQAPDVYVAFGVPKEDRGSFNVFEEGGVFPQAVFEVRSPSNTAGEMAKKLAWYDKYGAVEYYDFDPKKERLRAYARDGGGLAEVAEVNGYVSPLLGIRFDTGGPQLRVYYPDGSRFLTFQQVAERADDERRKAEEARRAADRERERADQATAELRRLRERLRAAGIDPDAAG